MKPILWLLLRILGAIVTVVVSVMAFLALIFWLASRA